METYRVNIVGASGYVGGELVRLVHNHPQFVLKSLFANSKAGTPLGEWFPNFVVDLPETVLKSADEEAIDDCDVLFLALPHTQSQQVVASLKNDDVLVVDLSADFRFEDVDTYEKWYDTKHRSPESQEKFVYGLPEFHREELRNAQFIASPGCYPTASILAVKPFIEEGILDGDSVIVNAVSGVSGSGVQPKDTNTFANVDANFIAYGLINHRHTPEIAKELGVDVLFTPHLGPYTRGIVATCYIKSNRDLTTSELSDVYYKYYADEPFTHIHGHQPSTKQVAGTNNCIVSAFYDDRTKNIVAISAIDNLIKGASGQAIQAANIALGLEESTGLNYTALWP